MEGDDEMIEKLISNLKDEFSSKGLKLIKEDGFFKISEVRYELTHDNRLRLKYQESDHDKIMEILAFFVLFYPKPKLDIIHVTSNSVSCCMWLKF